MVDTAGIRQALDEAESIGIRKSMEALAEADLVLVVRDATEPQHSEDDALLDRIAGRNSLQVLNKSDLTPTNNGAGALRTSAVTGEGIDALISAVACGSPTVVVSVYDCTRLGEPAASFTRMK